MVSLFIKFMFSALLTVLGLSVATSAPAQAEPPPSKLRQSAITLEQPADLDQLINAIGDRSHILLGEATHGTAEFYTWRTEISRRLIQEKGFSFIAVEGDWANCQAVNRFVKLQPDSAADAPAALQAFSRWPEWMWNNRQVAELISWLREHNAGRPPAQRVGFYGLDLYTPWESMRQAVSALQPVHPELSAKIAKHYQCLSKYQDPQEYLQALSGGAPACAKELKAAQHLIQKEQDKLREADPKLFLLVKQHAAVTVNAERHYRAMRSAERNSWNKRARHFFETYERLIRFHGEGAKGIVWAHNTHIGDARETDMVLRGNVNIGQLAREHFGPEQVFAVGFGTNSGTVIAGRHWGGPREIMPIAPAPPGTWEHKLTELELPAFYVLLGAALKEGILPTAEMPHRAIGVVYQPSQNPWLNFVPTRIARRYDAFIFISETQALEPIAAIKDNYLNKLPEK